MCHKTNYNSQYLWSSLSSDSGKSQHWTLDWFDRWFGAEAPREGWDKLVAGLTSETPRREASRSSCQTSPIARHPVSSSTSDGILDRSRRIGHLLLGRPSQGSPAVGITDDCQKVGGFPISSHDDQTVHNQLPLHPWRPHMRCWQVHSLNTTSTLSFDGFVEFALCCNLNLKAVIEEVESIVLYTAVIKESKRQRICWIRE